MSEERPLHERPAARPSESPTQANQVGQELGRTPPVKGGLGCFGTGCIVALILVAVIVTIIVNSVGGSTRNSSDDRTSDPIEQARVVLETNYGESYSYSEVKTITDRALSYFSLPITDEYRSKAWSSVLGSVKQPELSHVSPMEVMRCITAEDETGGMDLPEWAALCAVMLK